MTVGVIGIIFTIGIAVCIELPKRYINEKTSVLQLLRTTISHIDEYMPHCFLYSEFGHLLIRIVCWWVSTHVQIHNYSFFVAAINLVACVTYIWAASQVSTTFNFSAFFYFLFSKISIVFILISFSILFSNSDVNYACCRR